MIFNIWDRSGVQKWTDNKELKKKKDVPFDFRSQLRMRDKMETKNGREIYAMRKITVEPELLRMRQIERSITTFVGASCNWTDKRKLWN